MERKIDDREEHHGISVETSFNTDYEILPASKLEPIMNEVANHRTSDRLGVPPPGEDLPANLLNLKEYQNIPPHMLRMWLAIDQKIDSLIRLFLEKEKRLENPVPGIVKNLSSTGLSLKTEEPQEEGTSLLIRLSPPAYPPFTIDVVARVKSKQDEDLYELEIIAVNPDDRETMITYLFKRQREILRGKTQSD